MTIHYNSKTSTESTESVLSGCTLGILSLLLGIALRGLIIAQYWAWFVVGYFHLPPLGIWLAYGFSMFVSLFVPSNYQKDERAAKMSVLAGSLYMLLLVILNAVFYLGLGYIVHSLI